MRTSWALFVFVAFSHASVATQPLVFNMMASPGASAARASSGRNTIDLVMLNRSPVEQRLDLPRQLTGELRIGSKSWPIELKDEPTLTDATSVPSRAADSSAAVPASNRLVTVAPGGFSTRTYGFVAPSAVTGLAMIELNIPGHSTIRGVVELTGTTGSPATPVSHSNPGANHQKPTTNLARVKPAAAILERTFANRIAPHEPIYFIYGADAPAAKFQFSFKYKLLGFGDNAPGTMVQTLQFAFTQRSLWDINGQSSPFYDTSYMPEIIFESLAAEPDESDRWFTWLGYQAGYKHESNGRDGPLSRSLNTVYVRPVVAFGALDGWHLLVMPELWAYIDSLDDNPALKDYRGYGQLRLIFGRNGGPSLMATLWSGKSFDHRSVQLDLTFPVKTHLLDFQSYLLVQYFNGYGESLLSYRDKSETVRAGFSFVR